jgi:hypothetical protein
VESIQNAELIEEGRKLLALWDFRLLIIDLKNNNLS